MKTISRAAVFGADRMTRLAVVLSAMLACSVALAETVPPPRTPAAVQSAQRKESSKDWWLWSLVAVLSAGTIVTSVVIVTVPRGSLNFYAPVGAGAMAVTVRF